MPSYRKLQEEISGVFGDASELELLSLLVYGEARGESLDGKAGVAWVAINRSKKKGWFGDTLKEVILKPYQFSCFLPDDPNFAILKEIHQRYEEFLENDVVFRECYYIAKGVFEGWIRDLTDGALYYHSRAISPRWSNAYSRKAEIGNHIFYG